MLTRENFTGRHDVFGRPIDDPWSRRSAEREIGLYPYISIAERPTLTSLIHKYNPAEIVLGTVIYKNNGLAFALRSFDRNGRIQLKHDETAPLSENFVLLRAFSVTTFIRFKNPALRIAVLSNFCVLKVGDNTPKVIFFCLSQVQV